MNITIPHIIYTVTATITVTTTVITLGYRSILSHHLLYLDQGNHLFSRQGIYIIFLHITIRLYWHHLTIVALSYQTVLAPSYNSGPQLTDCTGTFTSLAPMLTTANCRSWSRVLPTGLGSSYLQIFSSSRLQILVMFILMSSTGSIYLIILNKNLKLKGFNNCVNH